MSKSHHTCLRDLLHQKSFGVSIALATHFPIRVMQIYEANFQFCDFIQHEKGGDFLECYWALYQN